MHSPPFGKIIVCRAEEVSEEMLVQCSRLFSGHYAKWGSQGPFPGQQVRLSASRLRSDYLFNDNCMLVMAQAKKSEQLVGHAVACRFPFRTGFAVWVSQLVVHKEFRSKGLATELLAKCMLGKDNIAWGLVSSHPHAIRALERITKRKCQPEQMSESAMELIRTSNIPYLQNCGVDICAQQPNGQGCRSIIHTNFYAHHSEVNILLEQQGSEWLLGRVGDGDEFFAFTFE